MIVNVQPGLRITVLTYLPTINFACPILQHIWMCTHTHPKYNSHVYHTSIHTPNTHTHTPQVHIHTHTDTHSSSREPSDSRGISKSSLIPHTHVFSHFYSFSRVEIEGKSHQPWPQGHLDRNLKPSGPVYVIVQCWYIWNLIKQWRNQQNTTIQKNRWQPQATHSLILNLFSVLKSIWNIALVKTKDQINPLCP